MSEIISIRTCLEYNKYNSNRIVTQILGMKILSSATEIRVTGTNQPQEEL